LVEKTKGASTSSIVVKNFTLRNLYVQIILQLKELKKNNGVELSIQKHLDDKITMGKSCGWGKW